MAARTSAGFGMIFAVIALMVLSIAGFVVFLILFNDNGTLRQQLADQESSIREIVRSAERSDPNIASELSAAAADGQSLVGYLTSQLNQTYGKVTGNSRDRYAALETKTAGIPGADTGDLLAVIRGLRGEIETTLQARSAAEAANESIFPIWSAAMQVGPLLDYVKASQQTERRIISAGISRSFG